MQMFCEATRSPLQRVFTPLVSLITVRLRIFDKLNLVIVVWFQDGANLSNCPQLPQTNNTCFKSGSIIIRSMTHFVGQAYLVHVVLVLGKIHIFADQTANTEILLLLTTKENTKYSTWYFFYGWAQVPMQNQIIVLLFLASILSNHSVEIQ